MARSRFCKPDFFDDPVLAQCSHRARLLFIATWQLADRTSVFEWDVAKIRKYAFGYEDVTLAEVSELLDELLRCGFLKHGMFNDRSYGLVVNLAKHQNFHVSEKPKFSDVAAGAIWMASTHNTVPAQCQHSAKTPELELEMEMEIAENSPSAVSVDPGVKPKRKKQPDPKSEAFNRRYRELFREKTNTAPMLDVQQNSQLKRLYRRFPDEAEAMLEFFFSDKRPFYRSRAFSVGTLVANADAIRVEMQQAKPKPVPSFEDQMRAHAEQAAREEAMP